MLKYEWIDRSRASARIVDLHVEGPADEEKAFMLGLSSAREPGRLPSRLRSSRYSGPAFVKLHEVPAEDMSLADRIAAEIEVLINGLRAAAGVTMRPGSTSVVFDNGDCLVFSSRAQREAFELGRRAFWEGQPRMKTPAEALEAFRPKPPRQSKADLQRAAV